jgi:hypothetical protein
MAQNDGNANIASAASAVTGDGVSGPPSVLSYQPIIGAPVNANTRDNEYPASLPVVINNNEAGVNFQIDFTTHPLIQALYPFHAYVAVDDIHLTGVSFRGGHYSKFHINAHRTRVATSPLQFGLIVAVKTLVANSVTNIPICERVGFPTGVEIDLNAHSMRFGHPRFQMRSFNIAGNGQPIFSGQLIFRIIFKGRGPGYGAMGQELPQIGGAVAGIEDTDEDE